MLASLHACYLGIMTSWVMPDSGVLTCLLPSITPPSHLSCSCCNSEPRRDASLLIVGNSMSCNMYAKFLIALIRGDHIWGESIQGPHRSKQRMSNPKPVSSLVYHKNFYADTFGDNSSCPNVHGWNARWKKAMDSSNEVQNRLHKQLLMLKPTNGLVHTIKIQWKGCCNSDKQRASEVTRCLTHWSITKESSMCLKQGQQQTPKHMYIQTCQIWTLEQSLLLMCTAFKLQ